MDRLMATQTAEYPVREQEHPTPIRLAVRRLVLLGTPLATAAVLSFHLFETFNDGVYSHVSPVVDTWLAVHLLFLPLLGLLAISLYFLLASYQGLTAAIGRVGIAMFAVFYIAMEAINGIAVGVLVREGQALTAEQQAGVAAVVEAVFYDPIVGGGTVSLLAVLGVLGYLIAVSAIAVVLRRAGAPLVPIALLVGSFIAILTHAGPTGVVGMAMFFVGVVWLELRWSPTLEVTDGE